MSAESTIKHELYENSRPEPATSNLKQEAVTPEKKRGRKKKCEMTPTPNNTINEEETSTRPNRCKRVDYSALLNDDDNAETPQKRKRTSEDSAASSTTINNQENKKKRGVVTDEMMNKIFSCMNSPAASSLSFDNLIQIPEEDLPPQPTVAAYKSKRGRKPKGKGLFGKKRADDGGDEYSTTEETVTCGRCNLLMDGDSWKTHKRNFHNDLAWKLGEPAIDLNDRALVTSILSKVYKSRRPLNCENCGLKKKSVLGFLSHKMQCEKSVEEIVDMKVKCELCGNTMLPVSMAVHMRLSHGPKSQDVSELIVPKSKRKSAAKAQDMIHLVAKDSEEATGSGLQNSIHHFITTKSNFLTTLQAKQKLSSELEKYGHIKCKFAFCSVLIQNVAEAIKHMLEHYSSKKPDVNFGCRSCLSIFHSSEVIMEHVFKEHLQNNENNDFDFEASSSASEGEEVLQKSNPRKLAKDPRFLMKTKVARSTSVIYPLAFSWSSQFCKNNYNIPNLFQNLLPHTNNWQQLPEDLIETFSPEFAQSMDIAFRKTKNFINTNSQNYEWKKIELFESLINDSIVTMFCGGPITEMCWVPTPHDENVEQILSVSIALDFNKKYHIHELNSDPAMIQFWNFGLLDNQNLLGNGPKLEFCLCGDFGYVTHMEWCPSGCYDVDAGSEGNERLQRLGLLAVASTDSFVHVFSVPKPSQLKTQLIKPSPVLKLQMQTETEQKLARSTYIPTKLSWTKASGHRYIAVGYSNGLVALFDLNTTFPLLKSQETLHPIRTFQPHLHCITVLNLYHTSEGCRWLATASTDRHCKFWDLTNTSAPISVLKRLPVTDGVWLTHWASAIFGHDDDGGGGTPTLVLSVRDFRSEAKNILYSSAAITAVGGSDWLNGVAQGNSAGEVIGVFPHQLMVGLDNDRSLVNKKLLLSYGRVVEKTLNAADRLKNEQKKKEAAKKQEENSDSEAEEVAQDSNTLDRPLEPLDYEGIEAKYGVVFCDTGMTWGDKEDVQKLGYQSKYLLQERSDSYAAVKVTKISFNPNKQSYVYFACGYQSGFVRIASLKSLRERR